MLDYPVNIRSGPDTKSNIIGQLEQNAEIEVIERTNFEEKIDNTWAYWYKIKHQNIIGYIFGGYIAAETIFFDINKNGVNDYIYYRVSDIDTYPVIEARQDIHIYIDNKKVSSEKLRDEFGRWVITTWERDENGELIWEPTEDPAWQWNGCSIIINHDDENIIMILDRRSPPGRFRYVFHVYQDGNIEFIERYWEDYKDGLY
jgi:hypothetical protein